MYIFWDQALELRADEGHCGKKKDLHVKQYSITPRPCRSGVSRLWSSTPQIAPYAYSLDVRFAYITLFIGPLSFPPVMQAVGWVEAFRVDAELLSYILNIHQLVGDGVDDESGGGVYL